MYRFSDDNMTIESIIHEANGQWLCYTDRYEIETWYLTKRFGNQYGVIIMTYDEDCKSNDIDICIATMEQIKKDTDDDLTELPSICLMDAVQGKTGLKFLLWAKNQIMKICEYQPNYEDEVDSIRLYPSDDKRLSAYRRMVRYGFSATNDAGNGKVTDTHYVRFV